MRPTSAKRDRENRERRKVLAVVFERQNHLCARCYRHLPLDGHELVRRSQHRAALTDPDLIVGLCRGCHTYVTENPQAAHDEGWSIWGWEYRRNQ